MGGIAGYLSPESGTGTACEAVLRRMIRQLEHRGPAGEGLVVHGPAGLAQRRLAVLDRGGDAQPVRSADGRYLMAHEGEIYNLAELRAALARCGHECTGQGDAEVLLRAWQQWGTAAFDRYEGAFAMAILDTHTRAMVLARDQFGIQPLYFATDGSGRVACASELRAVLAAGVVPRRPDDLTIYRYLQLRTHDDTERTFFDRVSRLLPGQLVVIQANGRVHRETYTRLYYELDWLAATPRPYDAAARERIRCEFTGAVRRRLASDAPIPIGAALTGRRAGVAVLATAQRLLADQDPQLRWMGGVLPAFSARLPGERGDEPHLEELAEEHGYHLIVHDIIADPGRFLGDLSDFVLTQEEPVLSAAPYAQYRLMRAAGQRVTVLLDGLGADEVWTGYAPHLLVRRPHPPCGYGRPPGWPALGIGHLAGWSGPDRWARWWSRASVPTGALLAPDFARAHAHSPSEVVHDHRTGWFAHDIFHGSLPALLRYTDRNAARFAVRCRSPFLDPKLIRLLWSIDPAASFRSGWHRRPRDPGAYRLPPLVDAPRRPPGRSRPERSWLRQIRRFAHHVFRSESFRDRPYVDPFAVTTSFRAYLAGKGRVEPMLFWRLLNLELWLRELIDRDPTRPPADTFTHHYPRARAESPPPLPTAPVRVGAP